MDKRATPITKKHTINGLLGLSLTAFLLSGCSGNNNNISSSASPFPSPKANTVQDTTTPPAAKTITTDEQPSTVYYEIFVRSFYDSDGDGIGDLKGITKN